MQQVSLNYETKVIEPVGGQISGRFVVDLHTTHKTSLSPTFQEGCQSSRLAENKGLRIVWKILLKTIKVKTDQQASNNEKQVKEVVINVKEWTGDHGFTSGISSKIIKHNCWGNELQ